MADDQHERFFAKLANYDRWSVFGWAPFVTGTLVVICSLLPTLYNLLLATISLTYYIGFLPDYVMYSFHALLSANAKELVNHFITARLDITNFMMQKSFRLVSYLEYPLLIPIVLATPLMASTCVMVIVDVVILVFKSLKKRRSKGNCNRAGAEK